MPLKTLVKVGNITNLSDARYCAGMGVEILGFNAIANSGNFVDQKNYQDIRGWLSGPKFAIEIYNFGSTDLQKIIQNYAPDFLELDAEDLLRLPKNINVPLIVSLDESSYNSHEAHVKQWAPTIAYVIVPFAENDFFKDGVGNDFQVLLSYEEHGDIQPMFDNKHIKGIVLSGSAEIKPGLKDYDHLTEVLEKLDIDF